MRTHLASLFVSAATFGVVANAAFAQEMEFPARKSGQWEIQMVNDQAGAPNMTIKACVDEASDRQMMQAGLNMSKSMCPEQTMAKDGDSIVIDATCNFGGMNSKSHTVMTGDFQSAYLVKTTSEASGGMAAMAGAGAPTNMTQTATWVGDACTDGLAPGDMLMPGGMKVNVTDLMKMMGGG